MNVIRRYQQYILLLSVLFLLFNFSTAASSSGISSSITNNYTNISNGYIKTASNFIISKVGNSYFNNYIIYKGTRTITYNGMNITYVYFSYNIPFVNNATTVNGVIIPNLQLLTLDVYVAIRNNTTMTYFGPSMPYYISIPAAEASSYAIAHGLPHNGTTYAYITYGYQSNATNQSGYDVVRAVLGKKLEIGSNNMEYFYGMYLNINNNSILGEYKLPIYVSYYNPKAYLLGNFSIFNDTIKNNSTKLSNVMIPEYTDNFSTGASIMYTNTPNYMGMELILMVMAFGLLGTYIIKNLSK